MSVATVIEYEYHATIAAGTLISQNPAAGEPVDPNGSVTITISLGPNAAQFIHIYDKSAIMVFR